tara:strand:- start:1557 stop:1835 length:279 start_codon:yes stop_codon:yes gene_type:complete
LLTEWESCADAASWYGMKQRFWIDGVEYSTDGLSEEGSGLVKQLKFTQLRLHELSNRGALMTKAKNAYIADLKMEIVKERSGVDLNALFTDD